jgi:hypothetical protein
MTAEFIAQTMMAVSMDAEGSAMMQRLLTASNGFRYGYFSDEI